MELFFLALLILIMAFALGSGYPVAFALPGAAILAIGGAALTGWVVEANPDAYFHSGGPRQWLSAGVTNLRGVYWEVERDTLIAIPLFIFMGIMLQRSKIAEDLLVTMAQLFGPVPGGLGISVVFVGALLAATTGIVGATVVAMGLISLPAMLRNNYSPSLASGTIAASGTLGQIIPPSIVLIILADQLASATDQASTARKLLHKEATGELQMPSVFDVASTSAGEMFLGAFIPGLVLVGLYMLYILVYAIIRPASAPAVKYGGDFNLAFWGKVALTLIPPLALIFLVLGSIIGGIATVNQAGAIGAAGAMIMAGYRLTEGRRGAYTPALLAILALAIMGYAIASYDMNIKGADTPEEMTGIWIGVAGALLLIVALVWSGWRTLRIDDTLGGVMLETAKTTSLVFIILLGAAMLTAAFRAFGGEELVREFLNGLPGGFWTQFFIVMLVIFILGFFLDFIEIAVVVVPIVAPILLADPGANITAVWLGVMIGLNIQTSFLTPPFGFALFYLRGVAPAVVRTVQIYKGVIAFIGLQIGALFIVGYYPPLVNYLPNRVSFLSETSPPPRNPQLQLCLEDYVAGKLRGDGGTTTAAIARMRGVDLSALPTSMAKDLDRAFGAAETAMQDLEAAFAAAAVVEQKAPDYRPVLRQVRAVEKRIRRLEEERDLLLKAAERRGIDPSEAQGLRHEAASLDADIETLRKEIPDNWQEIHDTFAELTKAEDKARTAYRRAADRSFADPAEMLAELEATAAFLALEKDLGALLDQAAAMSSEDAAIAAGALEERFDMLAGGGDVKRELGGARRAFAKEDREKAAGELDAAREAYEEGKAWRMAAEETLKPELRAYVDAIRGTLGARQQPRLSREQALFLARCQARHRDISLFF